jgi:hypothetical protein
MVVAHLGRQPWARLLGQVLSDAVVVRFGGQRRPPARAAISRHVDVDCDCAAEGRLPVGENLETVYARARPGNRPATNARVNAPIVKESVILPRRIIPATSRAG